MNLQKNIRLMFCIYKKDFNFIDTFVNYENKRQLKNSDLLLKEKKTKRK
jgi:hypothetical protein